MMKQLIITASLLASMNSFASHASDLGARGGGNTTKKEASANEKVLLGEFWKKIREYTDSFSHAQTVTDAWLSLETGIQKVNLEVPYIESSRPEKKGTLISLYEQLEEELYLYHEGTSVYGKDEAFIQALEMRRNRLYNVQGLFDRKLGQPLRPRRKGRSSWGFCSQLVVGLGLVAITAWVVNSHMKKDRK